MDVRKIIDEAHKVGFRDEDIAKAETMLLDALAEHEGPPDSVERMHLMRMLASLYGFDDPPRWAEVERIYAEMEFLQPYANSKLQTGMMFFWRQQDFERAAAKLREAAEEGKEEDDRRTRYQALSNLGHALLELGRKDEAVEVFGEVEAMIPGRGFVVGDETGFLETLLENGLVSERVAKLAAILAPVSREEAFRERLAKVAREASGRG